MITQCRKGVCRWTPRELYAVIFLSIYVKRVVQDELFQEFLLAGNSRRFGNSKLAHSVSPCSNNTESTELLISSSLDLVEKSLKNLSFRDHIEVICLSIKLHLASIQRRRLKSMDKPADKAQQSGTILQILRMLQDRLSHELPYKMPCYHDKTPLLWELDVRNFSHLLYGFA